MESARPFDQWDAKIKLVNLELEKGSNAFFMFKCVEEDFRRINEVAGFEDSGE